MPAFKPARGQQGAAEYARRVASQHISLLTIGLRSNPTAFHDHPNPVSTGTRQRNITILLEQPAAVCAYLCLNTAQAASASSNFTGSATHMEEFKEAFDNFTAAAAAVNAEAEAARQRFAGAESEAAAATAAFTRAQQLTEQMRQAGETEAAAAANSELDPGAKSALQLEGVAAKMKEACAAQAARTTAAAAEQHAVQAALAQALADLQNKTAQLRALYPPLAAAAAATTAAASAPVDATPAAAAAATAVPSSKAAAPQKPSREAAPVGPPAAGPGRA